MSPKIRGIDLFCGAGGVTHGFRMAGVQMALGVDSNPSMKSTFEKNNKTPFLCADIQKLTVEKIVELSKIKKNSRNDQERSRRY
jgi:DNA (cytosine-5)-methyltransferase 1